ncbi:MAG: hypothetical protein BRC29_03670 [Nanohaloarchaea archaeon SW_7_43_1]|nr:MAG: hypothetical protein BRC29_03670 [Nanohaloarchaea archaeon SW_7_43_1]
MSEETDLSVLNTVNIKRFTESFLRDFTSQINKKSRSEWKVELGEELQERFNQESMNLIFSSADKELGRKQTLAAPGTRFFQQMLDITQGSFTSNHIELESGDLQLHKPEILEEASHLPEVNYNVSIGEFESETEKKALVFHFKGDIQTKASFHRERMQTVTIDPETGEHIPHLSERLLSHLPKLANSKKEHREPDIPKDKIRSAHEKAEDGIIDKIRPSVIAAQEEASISAEKRMGEISEKYKQRRKELDKQVKEKEEEINKWQEKYRRARKDSTKRKYTKNRREAEEELESLKEEVKEKKEKLGKEEQVKIDEVVDKNSVDVEIDLLGFTEISYETGKLNLVINDQDFDTHRKVSYIPATDSFHGLNCDLCEKDILDGAIPLISECEDIVCDSCSKKCRDCGKTICSEHKSSFKSCHICSEDICPNCITECSNCGEVACESHRADCSVNTNPACLFCGEECNQCTKFTCDDHLTVGEITEELYCSQHIEDCEKCGMSMSSRRSHSCIHCGDALCDKHRENCHECEESICQKHAYSCKDCTEDKIFCKDHGVNCIVCNEKLCEEHREKAGLKEGFTCEEHIQPCEICKIPYETISLENHRCPACTDFKPSDNVDVSEEIRNVLDEHSKAKVGLNSKLCVVYVPKRLRRGKIIVLNRKSGEKIRKGKIGLMNKLTGGP